ncbi:EcsC family protein [Cereibacter ovatus]|uniref:EcsC family protein n=1 Tax=Cereibacter ovatus TaxID=439529 RepID=A0A285D295_9RHOB|nr:EcsC family protein [Cereibacter ovatus]SNX73934.1 EcsC family protein [Cereibacter ovatus]
MTGNTHLPSTIRNPDAEIAALALRFDRANGPVIALMNRLGGSVEDRLALLPKPVLRQIETVTRAALERSHRMAGAGRHAPDLGRRATPALVALTGAAGGAGGLATSIAELPVTITVIMHAIRRAAEAEGFDPDDPAIRVECLRIFGAGSPLKRDDGVNTSFIGARIALSGAAVSRVLGSVAPRLAAALGQKLMAQAVPVLGAVAGATLNAAYLTYYREIAEIRFALLRLAQTHGAERVLAGFQAAVTPIPLDRRV